MFCVDQEICDRPRSYPAGVAIGIDYCGVGIIISGIVEIGKCFHLRGHGVNGVVDCASPDLALRESSEIEPGNDAEIIRASFERRPKIRVVHSIRIDDFTTRKNNLEIFDLITYKPIFGGEVGHST